MIKNFAKRKFIITSFAFFIFFITLLFPSSDEINPISETTYISGYKTPIYLLNKENYVSRTEIVTKNSETISKIEELVSFLTIDSKNNIYLPNIFKPIIPKDTKVLSLDIQDKLLKINFSKEFLNLPKDYEEKLIESLVYTFTDLDEVDGLLILVEGNLLEELPNSKKKLPHILTRDIGINTIYNIDNIRDVKKTTTYYLAVLNDITYYVPVTLLENNSKDKVEIVIERLKSNPHLETNLMSYLNASTELNSYELLEEEIKLSFNDALYEGLNKEEMKEQVEYSITLSLKDTLNIKNVTLVK